MTFREDWDAARPETRWFYRNFADRYLGLYGQFYRSYMTWMVTLSPMQLATRSLYYKQIWGLSLNIDVVPIGLNQSFPEPPDSLPFDNTLPPGPPDQFWAIPYIFAPDYRPKLRVRKSYWTGVSRRRRNL